MIKKVEFEAKNFDDAMNLAVDLLKVPSDKIYLTELGANGDEIMVEAIVDINLALEGKRYLESLLKCLNVEYKIEVRTLKNETEIYYNVFSENNPVLIGTYGRCLDAIQTLVRACIQTLTDEHIIVSVDIDDYKEIISFAEKYASSIPQPLNSALNGGFDFIEGLFKAML